MGSNSRDSRVPQGNSRSCPSLRHTHSRPGRTQFEKRDFSRGRKMRRVTMGYSMQLNQKTREGPQHRSRDRQFLYINQQVESFRKSGDPVLSVDTKKKELVGAFKNGGRTWRPKGAP